jgi:hypothetical protein
MSARRLTLAVGRAKKGENLKYRTLWIITVLLAHASFPFLALGEDLFLVSSKQIKTINEPHGILSKQPNGPFAAMLFNEFAQGTHIGIIYYKQMGSPADGRWWISERFWQGDPWSADITSFAWDRSGKYLFIGTSEVYGDGGLFRLDLYKKEYSRHYPKTDGERKRDGITSTEIIEISQTNDKLKVQVTLADYKTTRIVELPIN